MFNGAKKHLLLSLAMLLILLSYQNCAPVRFNQGAKDSGNNNTLGDNGNLDQNSSSGTGTQTTNTGTGNTDSNSNTGDGGNTFVLEDPITHERFSFNRINPPFRQIEFNPSNDDDTLNFNLTNFTYNGNGTCDLTSTKYEFDPLVDDVATFADFYPPVAKTYSYSQTNSACKAAEIAAKLKSLSVGNNCTATTQYLGSSEFAELNNYMMTSPDSSGDGSYILLEATFLQGGYSNLLTPQINLDSNCRCYYSFRYQDENIVDIMALPSHCAAHFPSVWSY